MQVTIKSRCWDGPRQKQLQLVERGSTRGEEVVSGTAGETLRRWERGLKSVLGYTVPVVFASSFIPYGSVSARGFDEPAQAALMAAAVPAAVKERILHAFDPLIDLAISLSYPIAGLMIAGGCLFIMIGNRERGMQMLQNSAIGYILVQLSPMFLNLLVGVGQTVS